MVCTWARLLGGTRSVLALAAPCRRSVAGILVVAARAFSPHPPSQYRSSNQHGQYGRGIGRHVKDVLVRQLVIVVVALSIDGGGARGTGCPRLASPFTVFGLRKGNVHGVRFPSPFQGHSSIAKP